MKMTVRSVATFLAATLAVSSCSRPPQETGFLSTYKNLQPVSSTCLRYIEPEKDLRKYNKFIIDPIIVKLYNSSSETEVSAKDIQHLTDFLFQQLSQVLTSKYTIVTQPGPDVARLRIAITDIKPSTPALNVLPQTKLLGLGLGELSVEAEIVDSTTGTQLAAIVESDEGSRLSTAGLSRWGDVEEIMRQWASRLKKRIDEIKAKIQIND